MGGHLVAIALMVVSVLAHLRMEGIWPTSVPSIVALAAMLDGVWAERLLGQVWWLAAVVLLTPLTAGIRRLRDGGLSGSSLPPGTSVLSGVGNIIMCALMLPADGARVSTGGHHAAGVGLSLFPVAAIIHGLICLVLAMRIAKRRSSRVMGLEMAAMGGSMLAMGVAAL